MSFFFMFNYRKFFFFLLCIYFDWLAKPFEYNKYRRVLKSDEFIPRWGPDDYRDPVAAMKRIN